MQSNVGQMMKIGQYKKKDIKFNYLNGFYIRSYVFVVTIFLLIRKQHHFQKQLTFLKRLQYKHHNIHWHADLHQIEWVSEYDKSLSWRKKNENQSLERRERKESCICSFFASLIVFDSMPIIYIISPSAYTPYIYTFSLRILYY